MTVSLVPKTNDYVTFWKIVSYKTNDLFFQQCAEINENNLQ